jgi:hypothetical protein
MSDEQLARIEKTLGTLATKDDLKALVTNDDFQATVQTLVSRDDFKASVDALATRHDLEALVTREDFDATVQTLVTRDDFKATVATLATNLEDLRTHMGVLHEAVRADIRAPRRTRGADATRNARRL